MESVCDQNGVNLTQLSRRHQFHRLLSQLKTTRIAKPLASRFKESIYLPSIRRMQTSTNNICNRTTESKAAECLNSDSKSKKSLLDRLQSNKNGSFQEPNGRRGLQRDRGAFTHSSTAANSKNHSDRKRSGNVNKMGASSKYSVDRHILESERKFHDITDVEYYILYGDPSSKPWVDSMYGLLARIDRLQDVAYESLSRSVGREHSGIVHKAQRSNHQDRKGSAQRDLREDEITAANASHAMHTEDKKAQDELVKKLGNAQKYRTHILKLTKASSIGNHGDIVHPEMETPRFEEYSNDGTTDKNLHEESHVNRRPPRKVLQPQDYRIINRKSIDQQTQKSPSQHVAEVSRSNRMLKLNAQVSHGRREAKKQIPVYLGGSEDPRGSSQHSDGNLSTPTTPPMPFEEDEIGTDHQNNKVILSYTIMMPNCALDSKENEHLIRANNAKEPLVSMSPAAVERNDSDSHKQPEMPSEAKLPQADITPNEAVAKTDKELTEISRENNLCDDGKEFSLGLSKLPDETDEDPVAKCNYWLVRRCPSTP